MEDATHRDGPGKDAFGEDVHRSEEATRRRDDTSRRNRAKSPVDPAELSAPPGLCADCVHALLKRTNRGTTYLRCGLASTDERFPRYPRLPVLQCLGYLSHG